MNRNLHSPTKLTEFARDFDVEPKTLFTKFVNKLTNAYNSGYNSINDIPTPLDGTTTNTPFGATPMIFSRTCSISSLNQPQQPTTSQILSYTQNSNIVVPSIDTTSPETSTDQSDDLILHISEERTPSNVIQRISNLMALKNNNLNSYKDCELQRFWMPDSKSKECYECSHTFSTFRRKHHCRLCGQIFCSKCCNQVVPGKIINCSGDLKVCTYCSKIVLSYIKSSDINSELKLDLQALQDDLASKFYTNDDLNQILESPASQMYRKVSVGYQEERLVSNPTVLLNTDRKTILQQSNSLRTLLLEMSNALPNQIRGEDLVAFLISNRKSANNTQAMTILNAMSEAGFIIPLIESSDGDNLIEFNSNYLYKLLKIHEVLAPSESFKLNLNFDNNTVVLSRPSANSFNLAEDLILPNTQDNNFLTKQEFELQNSLFSTTGAKPLLEMFCEHEELLLSQLLRNENLAQSWSKILLPICARIANSLRPELCGTDLMDIRNFVNFKKVPGGSRNESRIIGGAVFSKNVVHKEMHTLIEKPKVLLLQCAIAYQRVEGKFVSIESLLLQEQEYLRNVTARILSLKPNIVLVHKNVAGIAQDMLRGHNITLALDVKLSVLERLSRCLQCDVITSIDSNIGRPKLGTCDRFFIQNFEDQNNISKTLMFFEIASSPRGCCILLRGGTNNELVKVKRVALLLLFARYNWRLELSFLLDEFARPPSPKLSIFDSKDHSPLKNTDSYEIFPHKKETVSQESSKQDNKILKNEKKLEEKMFTKENVRDFSDPLRATDLSPSAYQTETPVELAVETLYHNRFRTALSSTVLSVSPFVVFPLPYLETEHGQKCVLRSFYPNELYYSKQWCENVEKCTSPVINHLHNTNTKILPIHTFLSSKITSSAENRDVQATLANFRACGGRLPKVSSMKPIVKTTNTNNFTQRKHEDEQINKDALDLKNHQRLTVLFCSYYYNPKAASSFCAQPSLLNMIFYGQNDIILGHFLEHYCFRSSYMCSSCNLPMLDHVRRYVHSMGCIQVKLKQDLSPENARQIMMTSWCSICHEMTPSVPMSKDTWYLSFAKYLELRFHNHAYKRRTVDMTNNKENTNQMQSIEAENNMKQCSHSLHRDHVQYFSYNGIVTSFMYTPIEIWEIGLPSLIVVLRKPKLVDNFVVLEDIKNFSLKGYEVYAKIYDKLAQLSSDIEFHILGSLKQILNRDQLAFKEKVGIVQTLLTEKVVNPYDITDAMFIIKKLLAESIELWGPRLHEAAIQSRATNNSKNETHVHVDSTITCSEELKPDVDTNIIEDKKTDIPALDVKDNESTNTEQPEHKENSAVSNEISTTKVIDLISHKDSTDKKSVKTLLRELLPSDKNVFLLQSPLSSNEHYCLSIGTFPVLVHDQDLSSVIAYSLVSNDYKKALFNMHPGYTSDSNYSPNSKRKSQENLIENEEKECSKESEKKSKSGLHIEVYFQDLTTQFTCKIYFAREFDIMRTNFVQAPKSEKIYSKEQEPSRLAADKKIKQQSLNPPELESKAKGVDMKDHEADDVRNSFARSLSESRKWEARGGKSGSKFSKTLDDRFVLKEMTKQDVALFENFAPNYFVYVNQCLNKNLPTLLAKILGVYKVTIKKKDSVYEKSLLVMENLFYNSEISNKFDLKGSDRNRLVDPTNQNGEIVLLDENLIQMSWSKPLYILSHSKTILREAIIRDASFLEKNHIMDYSLLVGLNSSEKLLVLGIIDYIRTFTFDKLIESFVKQTGFLGGQGKLPTVISPKLYKQRFSEAMERYFLAVPDRWDGLSTK